jgi:hypothetical protein
MTFKISRPAVNLIPPVITGSMLPGSSFTILTGVWNKPTDRVYTLYYNSNPIKNYDKVSKETIEQYSISPTDVGLFTMQEFALLGGVAQTSSLSMSFAPILNPNAFIHWDSTTVTGSVASWTDRIAGISASQDDPNRRPYASLTEMSGFPGVRTFPFGVSSSLQTSQFGSVVSGRSQITFVGSFQDFVDGATAAIIFEASNAFTTNNNAFGVYANDAGAQNTIRGGVRGGGAGTTIGGASDNLGTRRVVSIGLNLLAAGSGSVPFVRINGQSQTVTYAAFSSVTGAFANYTTNFMFGRAAAGTLPFSGVVGDIIFMSGVTQDQNLEQMERYVGSKIGVNW